MKEQKEQYNDVHGECDETPIGFFYKGNWFPIDIEKNAYDVSSELFSFKELRRGIVEHGRTCYIEGYKKHAELFGTFLVKNGYFNEEELHKAQAEFDAALTGKPELSIRYAEDVFARFNPWLPEGSCLTKVQKDIIQQYKKLDKEKDTLLIQKPRQKGVTTICKIIAYIEALNGKKVLYLGYGQCEPELRKVNNLAYHEIRGEISARFLVSKRFDLIIVEDMVTFTVPLKTEHDLRTTLTENGRMIIVGTPLEPKWRNYKAMKDFFKPCNVGVDSISNKITYTIFPDEQAYERAEKHPECKNEMLGQWND